jgi:hypothetical protein
MLMVEFATAGKRHKRIYTHCQAATAGKHRKRNIIIIRLTQLATAETGLWSLFDSVIVDAADDEN